MQFSDPEIADLRSLGVPIVAIGHDVPGAGCVRIDDMAAATSAIQHLLGLGHRRIGMISTYADQTMFLPVAHARRRAYLDTLRSAGLPICDELVMSVPHGLDGGEQAMRRLLALPDPPTAVFAESDELAFGALSALRRTGRHVSVIGFDDHELSALLDLTTVRQRVFEQGVLAAGMLRRAMTVSDWTPKSSSCPPPSSCAPQPGPSRLGPPAPGSSPPVGFSSVALQGVSAMTEMPVTWEQPDDELEDLIGPDTDLMDQEPEQPTPTDFFWEDDEE